MIRGRFLQSERQFQLFAYVILENHLHLIASAPDLSVVMRYFESFTARQIIDLLEQLRLGNALPEAPLRERLTPNQIAWRACGTEITGVHIPVNIGGRYNTSRRPHL